MARVFKKMRLVSEEDLEHLREKSLLNQNPALKAAVQEERKIDSIVKEGNSHPPATLEQIEAKLAKLQDKQIRLKLLMAQMKDQRGHQLSTTATSVTNQDMDIDDKSANDENTGHVESEAMLLLPERYHDKARLLLRLLLKLPNISIDKHLHLIKNGRTYAQSNVAELLRAIFVPSSLDDIPQFAREFVSDLARANVPKSMLLNSKLKELVYPTVVEASKPIGSMAPLHVNKRIKPMIDPDDDEGDFYEAAEHHTMQSPVKHRSSMLTANTKAPTTAATRKPPDSPRPKLSSSLVIPAFTKPKAETKPSLSGRGHHQKRNVVLAARASLCKRRASPMMLYKK